MFLALGSMNIPRKQLCFPITEQYIFVLKWMTQEKENMVELLTLCKPEV